MPYTCTGLQQHMISGKSGYLVLYFISKIDGCQKAPVLKSGERNLHEGTTTNAYPGGMSTGGKRQTEVGVEIVRKENWLLNLTYYLYLLDNYNCMLSEANAVDS